MQMATVSYFACPDVSASGVETAAQRDLDLLNAIDRTVSNLSFTSGILRTMAKDVEDRIALVERAEVTELIDPTGNTCELLNKAADSARRIHENLLRRKGSAVRDRSLTDEDGVVDAYDELIDVTACFHNLVEDLRDAIETKDSLRSPVVGSFSNVEDLIAALKS